MPSLPKKSRLSKPLIKHARTRSNNKLYNDPEWRRYSTKYRSDNPYCACGCGKSADCVDHIIPINYEGSFWDTRNHQGLNNHCHSRKSGRESQGIYEPYILNQDGERIPARGDQRK